MILLILLFIFLFGITVKIYQFISSPLQSSIWFDRIKTLFYLILRNFRLTNIITGVLVVTIVSLFKLYIYVGNLETFTDFFILGLSAWVIRQIIFAPVFWMCEHLNLDLNGYDILFGKVKAPVGGDLSTDDSVYGARGKQILSSLMNSHTENAAGNPNTEMSNSQERSQITTPGPGVNRAVGEVIMIDTPNGRILDPDAEMIKFGDGYITWLSLKQSNLAWKNLPRLQRAPTGEAAFDINVPGRAEALRVIEINCIRYHDGKSFAYHYNNNTLTQEHLNRVNGSKDLRMHGYEFLGDSMYCILDRAENKVLVNRAYVEHLYSQYTNNINTSGLNRPATPSIMHQAARSIIEKR